MLKKKSLKFGLLVIVISVLMLGMAYSNPADENTYIYMRVNGMQGEATEQGYQGWIVIDTFDYSVNNLMKNISGMGNMGDALGGMASAMVENMTIPVLIKKDIDKSTPLIYNAAKTGKSLDMIEIAFVRNSSVNGQREAYMKYEFKNVKITSISTMAKSKQDFADLITMSYGSVKATNSAGTEYYDTVK